jgi:hypothetical protein
MVSAIPISTMRERTFAPILVKAIWAASHRLQVRSWQLALTSGILTSAYWTAVGDKYVLME